MSENPHRIQKWSPITLNEQIICCEDSLIILKELKDNSIDLIFTDPPYGISEAKSKSTAKGNMYSNSKSYAPLTDYGNLDWDDNVVSDEHISEMLRVGKHLIMFGGNYYSHLLPASSNWIVWDKETGDNSFADAELVYTNINGAVRIIKYEWRGMFRNNKGKKKHYKERRYHPTQKPVALCEAIIEMYLRITKKNRKCVNLILDPFCGSGSIPVACKQLGMRWSGIDSHEPYTEICRERLRQEMLF